MKEKFVLMFVDGTLQKIISDWSSHYAANPNLPVF